jgi:1,4-dihydroxy-2-naphthoate octaprenyltransferase
MSFLLFFRGMIATLVVFAIATFALTQSAWTTFVSTAICAVTIQVGYFAAGRKTKPRNAPNVKVAPNTPALQTILTARPLAPSVP